MNEDQKLRHEYLREQYQIKIGGYVTDRQNSCVFPNDKLTEQQLEYVKTLDPEIVKSIQFCVVKYKKGCVLYRVRVPVGKRFEIAGAILTSLDSTIIIKVFLNGVHSSLKLRKQLKDVAEFIMTEARLMKEQNAALTT